MKATRLTCWVWLGIIACAQASAVSPTTKATVPAEIEALEKAVLQHRRAISSGQMQIHLTIYTNQAIDASLERMIYFDNERFRQDETANNVTRTRCFGDGVFFKYCTGSEAGRRYALEVQELKHVDRNANYIYEPLKVMFYPGWSGLARSVHMESIIGAPDRTNFEMAPALWEGEQAVEVSFSLVRRPDARVRYCVVPTRGYSIVMMEARTQRQEIEVIESVHCALQRVADQLWFPKTVRYQKTENGKQGDREDMDFNVISLNQPLDPRLFTPAGMNVAPDTPVAPGPRDARVIQKWDGKAIVPMGDEERMRIMFGQRNASRSHRRAILIGASIVCVGVGVIVYWWHRRRKPASGS